MQLKIPFPTKIIFPSLTLFVSSVLLLQERPVSLASVLENTSDSENQSELIIHDQGGQFEVATAFTTEEESEDEVVAFTAEYRDTEELFRGESKVVQAGSVGHIYRVYAVSYWRGEEIDRQLISEETTPPVTQIINIGTKKNIRELETPEGELKYSEVFSMRATSYDGNCKGCTGKTYLGTAVTFGVCAVDPRVIPLRSYLYIPGYGVCQALDIGGAIKGMKVDLGFADVREGWWSTRTTNVYLLEK